MRFKLSLQPYLLLAFLMLATPFVSKAATFYFNTLYKGTGTSYVEQTQNIANLITVNGTNFQFYQAGAQFSGNSINGTLTYLDNSGNNVTIYLNLNRQNKTGSTSNAFYGVVFTDATFNTSTGEAFLLVIPGKESLFTAGSTVGTSSDPVANALNAVVNAMPTATLSVSTLSGFTACPNTASTAQSFTLTASNLSANVIVTAPTGFLVSSTQSGTYTSSISLTPTSGAISNGIVWVELYSSTVGSNTGKISVASNGAGTQYVSLTGTIANVVGGTISGSTTVASATNSTTLTLSGNTGTIQWQSSTDNTTYTDITGATSSTYLATNITATTYYRAVITNNACTSNSNIATITYDNGCYSFDINDFTKNGNATDLGTGIVRLTQASGGQNGSIWNKNKVNLDFDFDISSKINLGNIDAGGADGIAFVLQNYAVNAGSTGGGLGYQGISPSFAVEFDTYYNGGADPGSGADHIALVKNGLAANLAAHSEFATPVYGEMEDGLWHDVRFVWTASTKNFKVYWNGNNTPIFDVTVDLKANIFNGQSNVYFGLTAATGGSVNLQQVQVPTYCLVKQVLITPKPGTNNTNGATTFCSPGDVVLEASSNASYVWYKDGVVIPNATSKTITVSESGIYKVDGVNFQGNTTTSDNLTVTVSPSASAGTISSTNTSVCSGGNNSTTISLTGSVGTIQWQRSTDGTTFTNITGATSATYTATNLTVSTYYRAVVTSGNCGSVNSGTASITVSQCIVANPDINATNVNTEVTGNVNTNDITTSGTTYGTPTPSSSNPAGSTLVLNNDGTYTFKTPTPGRYLFYVPVCAQGQTSGCAVTTLEITVIDPTITTNPPAAKNDYSTTKVNTPAVVNVLTNDKPANNGTSLVPSSVKVVTPPANGSVTVDTTTGKITFTPSNSFTGTDSLDYNVCDNASPSNCQVATVYFKVSSNSVSEYTTADDDFNTFPIRSSATGNVLLNDVNSAGNTLTVTNYSTPLASQGTILINADGSYTFTPTATFYGPLDITYNACTSGNVCATATLHLLVTPVVPASPVPINGKYVIGVKTNPTTVAPTVTQIPNGCKVQYCDVNGANCTTTAPVLPNVVGTYIWCVRAIDTVTNLVSTPCKLDTVVILAPYSVVDIKKQAQSVVLNPDGTLLVTFNMKVINKTDAAITAVTVKDDLSSTFNTSSGISVYSLQTFGGLVKNSLYDGIANIDLVSNQSSVAGNTTDSLILKVLISNNNISGNFTNIATLNGTTKYGTLSVLSNDPILNPSDTTKRTPTGFTVPKVDVIVAGGFSPNRNGYNDKWIIIRPFGTRIEVKVFNRWGNIVYENGDYKNDWDGRGQRNFAGDFIPEGTYFYIVNAIDPSGAIQKFASSLTIAR